MIRLLAAAAGAALALVVAFIAGAFAEANWGYTREDYP